MADNFAVVEIGQEYLDWATKLRQDRRPDAGAVTHDDVGRYAVQCPDGTIAADGFFDRDAAQGYANSLVEDEWFDVTGFTRADIVECIRAGWHKIYAGYVGDRAPDLHCWMAAPDSEWAMRGPEMGHLVIDRVDIDPQTGIVKMWITAKCRKGLRL